jgi:hypothetical protein
MIYFQGEQFIINANSNNLLIKTKTNEKISIYFHGNYVFCHARVDTNHIK